MLTGTRMRLTPPKFENPASTCAAPSADQSFGRATIAAEIPPEKPWALSLCANVAVKANGFGASPAVTAITEI